jgi:hypothetical protein
MDEKLKNVLLDLRSVRDMADTCLDRRGNKWENDHQLVLERIADKLDAILDHFGTEGL